MRVSALRPWPGELVAALALLPLLAALLAAGGFAQWWTDARGWSLLLDTLRFAGLAGVAALLGGAVLAASHPLWRWVACVPLVLPASLVGSAWIVALGRTGVLGGALSIFDWPVAAVVVGLRYAGLAALLLSAWPRRVDPAARVFRVRHAWWWLHVRPRVRPFLLTWALVTLWCAGEPILPSMFLIHTYATQVLVQYNALLDLPGAVALATPMIFAGLVLMRLVMPTAAATPGLPQALAPQPRRHWPGLLVAAATVGVPVAVLVVRGGQPRQLAAAFGQLSPELLVTLGYAAVAVPACVLGGWLLAARWSRALDQQRWTLAPWAVAMLIVPASVVALGWVRLSGLAPVSAWRDSPVWLASAYAVRFLPVAALVFLIDAWRRPRTAALAARVHGVPAGRRCHFLVWPDRRAALASALLIVGLLVVTELDLSLLLSPPGTTTVGVRLYTLIHTAPDAQVAASALAVLLVLLPGVALLVALHGRRRT